MNFKRFLGAALCSVFLISQAVFATPDAEYEKMEQILNYAANLYIDDSVTSSDIWDGAVKKIIENNPELANELIKAAFQSLDDYSEFYTAEEYKLFNRNMNHIVYGIGVIIQQMDDYVTVMTVLEDGAAQKAGVMEGDQIVKVDGVDVKGESVDKVQDLVVGELGTEVTVTFLRDGREITYTMQRGEVKGETAAYTVLKGDVAYLRIVNFSADTDKEVAKILDKLDEEKITKIILDLRDNPGGYLDSAVNIASFFVPEGVIVSTVYRSEWENENFYSKLKNPKYELAVLVNENTASASEVLASAIQDSGVGILIGNKTYGKGVIQQMFEIWDGCAFKITTGKYFTRNGKDINGIGIKPDEDIYNTTRKIDLSNYKVFDYVNKPSVGVNSENTAAAKERLRILGYYQGIVDDYFDNALFESISDFQEENGLFPYGVLDISTQKKIQEVFKELDEKVDNQLIRAYGYFGGKANELY
ncbi:MAG: PDZ domain-containing protein [Firmicutes bacterium]|nr:PDZ domain-containing protein [Bacillota bacterium]